MTKTEQAELQELGLTEDGLAQTKAKVDRLMNVALGTETQTKLRKPRSDKGVPKAPKPLQQAHARKAFLSQEQAAHLGELISDMRVAEVNLLSADQRVTDATAAYHAYLNELMGK